MEVYIINYDQPFENYMAELELIDPDSDLVYVVRDNGQLEIVKPDQVKKPNGKDFTEIEWMWLTETYMPVVHKYYMLREQLTNVKKLLEDEIAQKITEKFGVDVNIWIDECENNYFIDYNTDKPVPVKEVENFILKEYGL